MAAKSSQWRPGPTVCRCCLAEGCYKDISTEYFWMGKREVYSDMLSDTFDVSISFSQSGGPNSNSRLICEPCISRLRDATEFKKQVQECEKTFMQHLSGVEIAEIEIDPVQKVKIESIKEEKILSDDDGGIDDDDDLFLDKTDFGADDDDDDDDLDDEPLTRLATKVPKKESEADLIDILEQTKSKVAEKRKSTTKTKSTPTKKAKTSKQTVKPSVSQSSKKEMSRVKAKPKHNAEAIVKYTTAYPFRLPTGDVMVCVYCMTEFNDAADYRAHMEQDHKTFKVKHAFIHVNAEDYGKVDITDMRCRLCKTKFKKLESITAHLILDHGVNINLEAEMPLQPYLLDKGSYKCGVCEESHLNFRQLGKHLSVHYHKFTCDVCGTSYKSNASLNRHKLLKHASKKYPCHKCLKGFDTSALRREHLINTKECWHYCCQICGERFLSWRLKQDHLVQAHGKSNRTYPCKVCGEAFPTSTTYRVHFMIAHSENPLQCSFCDMKFENKRRLDDHIVCHTKEKKFQCPHCPKNFSRKKSLWQHSWVHNEYKRFVCSICDKKFNQKVSLKGHLKSYHPETINY